jgi:CBS domain-containing protein
MTITAADIMTKPAITVSPRATIAEIASVLAARGISAVPVCAADGTLLGIISEADILKPFRASARARRDWWLGVLAEGEDLPHDFLDYLRQDTRRASDVMAHPVVTAPEQTTLPHLAELLVKHNVRRLPIERDGKVVGIVSRADMVRAIAADPTRDD